MLQQSSRQGWYPQSRQLEASGVKCILRDAILHSASCAARQRGRDVLRIGTCSLDGGNQGPEGAETRKSQG